MESDQIMNDQVDLLIIDDHIMFREGLVSLFQSKPDFKVVGQGGTVAKAVQLYGEVKPDLLLLDYYLPDGTGLDAIKAIIEKDSEAIIVLLTHTEDDDMIYAAISDGAKGCLIKNQPSAELVNSLRRVIAGEAALTRKMTRSLIERISDHSQANISEYLHPALLHLTTRELEILSEIVNDASNKEIAGKLSISIYTVKNHVSNILSKLELKNRREAATFARRYKIGTNR